MRLVFLLYAEDRDLLPSHTDADSHALYENYSVRDLLARLSDDEAQNPDTMDERLAAGAALLALFRLIHGGDGSGWIVARGGKLFDPDTFPFLEGRAAKTEKERVLPVSDGCVLRILRGLMILRAERLSYRGLDVEQIGSVYETVMGFTVETASGPSLAIKAGKNNRTPVFVDCAALAKLAPEARQRYIKEATGRANFQRRRSRRSRRRRMPRGSSRPWTRSWTNAAAPAMRPRRRAPRSCSRPTSAAGPAAITRRARSPSRSSARRWRQRSNGWARTQRQPRSLTSRSATRPWARVPSWSRPAGNWDSGWCSRGSGRGPSPRFPPTRTTSFMPAAWWRSAVSTASTRNPMATDLARLSLWLATLAREHEFTFLDHALKTGDSLIGLSRAQIAALNWDAGPGHAVMRSLVRDRLNEVLGRSQRDPSRPG